MIKQSSKYATSMQADWANCWIDFVVGQFRVLLARSLLTSKAIAFQYHSYSRCGLPHS
ncbi:MAG: hypothetical protein LDL41_22865 [Coleofasciculus sp. S288]|nr:hypothetical protein [Coleofasciculus sp. S288]